MKNHLTLAVLAAVALQSAVTVPAAFADEARRDRHEARHEERRAEHARADELKNDLTGHPIRAELDARRANHEERRADKHAVESHYDR